MKLKFKVFAFGDHTFRSKKTDRDIRQARLIGSLIDPYEATEIPCIADLGYDGKLDVSPVVGETYFLDVSKLETENAMLKVTFATLSVVPLARELKH